MARVLIAGGGFGGIVAAESLAKRLGDEHQITLVSRNREFLFYPSLVRLAFGDCEPDDLKFDIREAMDDRKVHFVAGEVTRINPHESHITITNGDIAGDLPYDCLVIALGRRLKSEQVKGFFEHAHHVLGIRSAQKFGAAAHLFEKGRAVIGYCPGAKLPVPVFETAFALSRLLEQRGRRDRCEITVVSGESPDEMFGGIPMSEALQAALESHRIELVSDFAITEVTRDSIIASDGRALGYDLNMIIPPFGGPAALAGTGITDEEGYIRVDKTMRVRDVDRTYAVGDCVSFKGPKMGYMAVRQGEVAAANLASEIQNRVNYDHDMMLVIDAGGDESIFVRKDLWSEEPADIQHSRFWAWAKRKQERYWKAQHA